MGRQVKVAQGTWCMAFGLTPPATLEQAVAVIAAFGYDGVELAGFLDHVTVRRFPAAGSQERLRRRLDELGLEPVAIAPAPGPDDGLDAPWALTDGPRTVAAHRDWWARNLELAARLGIARMRVDPGTAGPLPRDAGYDRVWERVVAMYRWLADEGAKVGCTMLWEMESNQPFNKPSEIVRLLDDVGHPNLKLLYDTSHFEAATVIGHNQTQPRELLPGGQLELLPKLAGRIGYVHLCDTDGDIAQDRFARKLGFGKGRLDFDALLPALVDVYDGAWWGVDAIPLSADAWGDSWTGLTFVREAVGRHVAAAADRP